MRCATLDLTNRPASVSCADMLRLRALEGSCLAGRAGYLDDRWAEQRFVNVDMGRAAIEVRAGQGDQATSVVHLSATPIASRRSDRCWDVEMAGSVA